MYILRERRTGFATKQPTHLPNAFTASTTNRSGKRLRGFQDLLTLKPHHYNIYHRYASTNPGDTNGQHGRGLGIISFRVHTMSFLFHLYTTVRFQRTCEAQIPSVKWQQLSLASASAKIAINNLIFQKQCPFDNVCEIHNRTDHFASYKVISRLQLTPANSHLISHKSVPL